MSTLMAEARPRLLIVDADGDASQKVGLALDGAGFEVGWTSFSPQELSQMVNGVHPHLLLVHAELASAQLSTLLSMVSVPVVVLCKDTSDEVFVQSMRSGIVELLREPFSARAHVPKIRMAMAGLDERTGQLKGRGSPKELEALVAHLTRARRTGGLLVGNEGRAFFVKGALKVARYKHHDDQRAVAAMLAAPAPWVFTEGAEANPAVDFAAPAPAVAAPPAAPALELARPEPGREAFGAPGSGAGSFDSSVLDFKEEGGLPPPPPGPARPAPVSSGQLPAVSAAPPPDPDAARTPMLFVDDDPSVVAMLGSYFSKRGYPVATAGDGVEAIQKLMAGRFELVIVDLNMPRLDGWGLLRLIREDFRTHEVPVALYSAHDDYRESLRLMHAGAQAYFPKTIKLTALEAQVREIVEPRRRFRRLLDGEGVLTQPFGQLGPQWVLRAVAEAQLTAQLDARDAWATWRGYFDRGRLVQMTGRVRDIGLAGDRALASFLSTRQAEGTLSRGGSGATDEGFQGQPTDELLARLVAFLADEQNRAREDQLSKARALDVHEELYRLYVTVGPPPWLPMVRLLCEQKLPPAQVIAQLQVAPMELAAVVKDLLRRGVVTLRA